MFLKKTSVMILSSVISLSAFASVCPVEIAEVGKSARIIIAYEDTSTSETIERAVYLPLEIFPLQEGLNLTLTPGADVQTTITYSNGVLIHENKVRSSFDKTTVYIQTSPDLTQIGQIQYTYQGTGLIGKLIHEKEKFRCMADVIQ